MKLKDFSLVKEEHDAFHVGHPKGKTLRIPKAGLSSDAHQKILGLKDGGEVSSNYSTDQTPFYSGNDQAWTPLPQDIQERKDVADASESGTNRAPAGIMSDIGQWFGKHIGVPAVDAVKDTVQGAKAIAGGIGDLGSGFTQGAGLSAPPEPAAVAKPGDSNSYNYNIASSRSPSTSPSQPIGNPYAQSYGEIMKGVGEQKQGLAQEAAAQGQLGQQEAQAAAQHQQTTQDLLGKYNQSFQDISKEYNSTLQDIKNQHINPNHYMENMSVPGRIATAIGLIAGGIGGGLTGQENPAAKFLNSQIERDVQSQRDQLGQKESILSANLKQFGNLHAATQMTYAVQAGIYSDQLKQAAVNSMDRMAKGRLLQAAGDLDTRVVAPAMQQMAQFKVMSQMMGGANGQGGVDQQLNALRIFAPERAKEIEGRYVPGVGVASVPVPEKPREELIARDDLHNQISNLRSWAMHHSGSLSPADINYGKALAAQTQDAYRRANGQGVFREAEADFVKGIVDQDPTKFLNSYRVDPKYRALENSNLATLNHLRQAYGLPAKKVGQLNTNLPQSKGQ